MTTFARTDVPPEPEKIRILSMDGGGIYGYCTALMLRRLCEGDPSFLSKDQVWLFAGTSAGAVNALILANAEDPREVVCSGELERFWHQRGVFANVLDPILAFWSWFGVTGWLGAADYELVLKNTFGEGTLGDLKHRVLITGFNWVGENTVSGRWVPKVFVNFPSDETDRSFLIRDVAYGAGAPPGLRAVRHKIGDGGIITPDPSSAALAVTVMVYRESMQPPVDEDTALGTLKRVLMLSVGVCTKPGGYWLQQFDFGSFLFNTLPTNPYRSLWFPPYVQVGLDGPSEAVTYQSIALLGKDFHRLDPHLLGPPEVPTTLVATALARFSPWQDFLLEFQDGAARSSLADYAVNDTLEYLQKYWDS